ncbi:MAG: DDE-type integrase/transposase/recombinase, partial [Gammaproteobacteria bacterium]|nr:DDE-type integrase/transposase/recombinase [Gammaproteobacteria bacterium]
MKEIIQFKDKGVVPLDPQRARWLGVMDAQLHLVEGILFYVDSSKDQRLCVIVPESERDHLLWELHYSPLGGHLGMDKTLEKVQRHYYWPKLRQDVLTYLRSCIVCASRQGQGRHYKSPLQPIPVPAQPFVTLAMDIVKLCRTREGNLFVLVSTDLFSKFVIASAMPDMTAESVAKVWLRDVLPFGAPARVLTDQGCQFTSELMKVVCESLQVKQLFTTTYHPQCD